jgi:DNA-binding GntR family transcriptional regulator
VIAQLVRQFGVSQTPVREALARLHAEGLAAFASNFGYRVASFPTEADYENWMEARLIVEVNSLRRAAAKATRQQIEKLQAINDTILKTAFDGSFESVRLFSELNASFHRELILIAGNPFLIKAYDQIWLGSQFSRVRYNRRARDQSRIAREHQAVIDALHDHNVEDACAALTAHIVDSLGRDTEIEALRGHSPNVRPGAA